MKYDFKFLSLGEHLWWMVKMISFIGEQARALNILAITSDPITGVLHSFLSFRLFSGECFCCCQCIFPGPTKPTHLCEKPHKIAVILSRLLVLLGCVCMLCVNKAALSPPVKRNCYVLIWILKQHQVRQQNAPDGEVRRAQSHLQDSKPLQFFVSFESVNASCVSFAGGSECQQWEGVAKCQVGSAISPLSSPSTGDSNRSQGVPSRSLVGRKNRTPPWKSWALTDLPLLPAKPAGWRKYLSPPPSLQAPLLLLSITPVCLSYQATTWNTKWDHEKQQRACSRAKGHCCMWIHF